MMASGSAPAFRDTYAAKEKDFTGLIAKLKSANIDAVYIGGYHNDVALMVRQARERGFNGEFASVDALNTSEFWRIAGSAGEGVRFTDAASLADLPSARTVVVNFRAHGSEPEGYALNAYAAVQAWAAGAEIAKSTIGADVAAALRANTIPTVLGDLDWDAKGDLKNPRYAWYVWSDGEFFEEP